MRIARHATKCDPPYHTLDCVGECDDPEPEELPASLSYLGNLGRYEPEP